MNYIDIILFFLIVFTFSILPDCFSDKKIAEKIPFQIRLCSWIEALFALGVFTSAPFVLIEQAKAGNEYAALLCILCFFFGILWAGFASRLSSGSRKARKVFLFLSVPRLFITPGVPFSIISVLLLYAVPSSRRFYRIQYKYVDKQTLDATEIAKHPKLQKVYTNSITRLIFIQFIVLLSFAGLAVLKIIQFLLFKSESQMMENIFCATPVYIFSFLFIFSLLILTPLEMIYTNIKERKELRLINNSKTPDK